MLNKEQIDYIRFQFEKENGERDYNYEECIYEILEEFPLVIEKRYGPRRWSEEVDYVYKVGDRYFKHTRDEPLTEVQEGQDTEDTLEEVLVKEKTIKNYTG